jgi:hypothetical protein
VLDKKDDQDKKEADLARARKEAFDDRVAMQKKVQDRRDKEDAKQHA